MITALPLRDQKNRPLRRTLADAIAALAALGVTCDSDFEILTAPWLLPDGRRTSLVQIRVVDRSGITHRLSMPSADGFSAKTTLRIPIEGEIDTLNGARFDQDGNVTLADGTHLHELSLHPTSLTFELTELQKYILHLTIVYLKAEKLCYRPLDPQMPVVILDYEALRKLSARNLKALQRHIFQSGLHVSRQEIADTLAAAGVRRPRSGRQSAKAHATFLM